MTDQQKQPHQFADDAPGYALAATIRKELVGYLAKAIISTAAVCFVGIGAIAWYYLEHRIPQLAHGVPGGAIMAFERECPEGWEVFDEATSRVIVGYGSFKNERYSHDQHGDLLAQHALREIGGEQVGMEAVYAGERQETASSGSTVDSTDNRSKTPRLLAATAPTHNHYTNIPPYIALYYCRSKF